MKKKPEYIEGPKARENFERFTSALLQVPTAGTRKQAKKKRKAVTSRKSSGRVGIVGITRRVDGESQKRKGRMD